MITPAILSDILTDQCMQLTATLLSQYDFVDLSHPIHEYWCPFENFAIRFNDLFAKELVELASLARVSLDVDSKFGSDSIVGSLSVAGEVCDLSFRQACNKIIHARSYEVDLVWSDTHPLDNGKNGYGESKTSKFKNPIIKTVGEYKGNDWRADIYCLKYIEVLREKFL